MQSQLGAPSGAAYGSKVEPVQSAIAWMELWRGAWVIFRKHMLKFRSNSMEIGGTLGWPLLWVATFGIGMERVVNTSSLGGGSYLSFITPGIIALTALSGAVNSGMTLFGRKDQGRHEGVLCSTYPAHEHLVGVHRQRSDQNPDPIGDHLGYCRAVRRPSHKQPIRHGRRASSSSSSIVMAFVGFSNGIAARSRSVGGYHTLLFVLNLPLLFLSNALYPLATMPLWMRVLAYLNPTTYAVDGLRQTLFGNRFAAAAFEYSCLDCFCSSL